MSRKKGLSMLDTMIPNVRLLPRARERACRLGWYLSSAAAFMTRARVVFFTTDRLFRTRETVATETPAFFATACKFIFPVFSLMVVNLPGTRIVSAHSSRAQAGSVKKRISTGSVHITEIRHSNFDQSVTRTPAFRCACGWIRRRRRGLLRPDAIHAIVKGCDSRVVAHEGLISAKWLSGPGVTLEGTTSIT